MSSGLVYESDLVVAASWRRCRGNVITDCRADERERAAKGRVVGCTNHVLSVKLEA